MTSKTEVIRENNLVVMKITKLGDVKKGKNYVNRRVVLVVFTVRRDVE